MAEITDYWLSLIGKYSTGKIVTTPETVQSVTPTETLPTVKSPIQAVTVDENTPAKPATENRSAEVVEVVDTEYNDDDLTIYKAEKGNLSFWCRLTPPQAALLQIVQYDISFCGRIFDYREFSLGFDPVGRRVTFRLSSTEYYALQCNEAGQIIDEIQLVRTLGRVHNIQVQLPPCFSGEIRLIIRRPADDAQNPDEG